MKLFVTGAAGMLGQTVMHQFEDLNVIGSTIEELDLIDPGATRETLLSIKPDVVVHCAAYTAVDQAESDPEAAYAVNALATANLASSCHAAGARLLAISTDYVFDGTKKQPYHEWDKTAPAGVYGASKLAGEEAIRSLCPNHLILRTAWLYGAAGPSFVHTMMRLGAEAGDPVRVVDDQCGNPTSTNAVAAQLRHLLKTPVCGTMHLTCSGITSWYGFAKAVFESCGFAREVVPCSSDEYPRPCKRPTNSALENRVAKLSGLPAMPSWRDALESFIARLR